MPKLETLVKKIVREAKGLKDSRTAEKGARISYVSIF